MPDKPPKRDEKALANLMNELAEGVLDMSDEEIIAEARAAGENPDDESKRMAQLVHRAITTDGQRKRDAARREYEATITAMQTRTYRLPADPVERRSLLNAAVRKNPRVRSAVTLQYRDVTVISDADVESQLRKLHDLGYLDADGKPTDEET